MEQIKSIALVAHDNRKRDLMEWVGFNWQILCQHKLFCTGTTGRLVESVLKKHAGKDYKFKYEMTKLKSGPLGGDQQLGALIAEGKIDLMIFFLGSDAASAP